MKRLANGLAMGTAALALASVFATAPAQARDWNNGWHRDGGRHVEWRDHGWRGYPYWGYRAWTPYGYYPAPAYYPPPVVYPQPGVSIELPLR